MDPGSGQKGTKLSKWKKKILPWLIQQEVPRIGLETMRSLFELVEFEYMSLEPWRESWPLKRGVKWSAKEFLGRSPTATESMSLSRALADLERAGLVKRTHSRGKRKRTSHIKLTKEGIAFCAHYLAGEEREALALWLALQRRLESETLAKNDNNSSKNNG